MALVRSPSSHCPSQVSWFFLVAASRARKTVEALALYTVFICVCARRWGTWSTAIITAVTLLLSGPTAAYVASPGNISEASEPSFAVAEAEHGHHAQHALATELTFEQSTPAEESDPLVAKKLVAPLGSHPDLGFRAAQRSFIHNNVRGAFGPTEAAHTGHAPRGPPAL